MVFDQCQYGLMDPTGTKYLKKPTVFYSNSPVICEEFRNKRCKDNHPHIRIEGSSLSKWAQKYPPQLCEALARCVLKQRRIATEKPSDLFAALWKTISSK